MPKPIKVLYNNLSKRFYATNQYKEKDGFITITGQKYDVTNDIAFWIEKYNITIEKVS